MQFAPHPDIEDYDFTAAVNEAMGGAEQTNALPFSLENDPNYQAQQEFLEQQQAEQVEQEGEMSQVDDDGSTRLKALEDETEFKFDADDEDAEFAPGGF